MGLVVGDRHIAIAVSEWPRYTAPVTGTHRGDNGGTVRLENNVLVQTQAF
jgi:hypothetical protein